MVRKLNFKNGDLKPKKTKINYLKIKKNPIFIDLELSNSEIDQYHYYLEKKIEIDNNCLENEDYCKQHNILFHLGFEKDQSGKLSMYATWCPRNSHYKFLYNSYSGSEISRTKLEKKYFKYQNESLVDLFKLFKKMWKTNDNLIGLYIYGSFGVGKTHLSYAMANFYLDRNKSVTFVTLSDVLAKIKTGFSNESKKIEADEIITAMSKADVLFIDDIGSENSADWFFNEVFINILNERMMNHKQTFFNSNYDLKNLEKNLLKKYKNGDLIATKRIIDRIKALVGNREYELKGRNYRYE